MSAETFVLQPIKERLKPLVRYWVRSGHRIGLTKGLAPIVASLGGTVLDVGGGREAPLDTAWPEAVVRFRLDISSWGRPNLVSDAAVLPIRSGTVDAVVMCEVLEHLPEPRRAIAEVERVLAPGGRLCGSVPFVMVLHGDPHDYFRYTESALRYLLEGFPTVDVRPHGNHLGGSWRLVSIRLPWLKVANPLGRLLSRRAHPGCPEGYTFTAQK